MTGFDAGLSGRVAIVTGAGQGIGREHAIYLGRAGARVVVNDIDLDGAGVSLAAAVAAEIVAAGGEATFAHESVATWAGAGRVVQRAVDTFGALDIVINNAGITRHSSLLDMPEDAWDLVLDVNLKGTFAMIRAAGRHWRERREAGERVSAAIVNTTSRAGLFPGSEEINGSNSGMANYGASKAGVIAITEVAARELAPLGVRVNVISPSARTRLTTGGALASRVAAPSDGSFDLWHPGNISPVVAWLASPACTLTGDVFWVRGGSVYAVQSYRVIEELSQDGAWAPESLLAHSDWFARMHDLRANYPKS